MAFNGLAAHLAQMIGNSPYIGWNKGDRERKKPLPCITFEAFMSCCLYDESYGYYRSGAVRVGKEGDFYTSAAIGHAMGEVLANYVLAFQQETQEKIALLEWGAGTGTLSAQIARAGMRKHSAWCKDVLHAQIENHPLHRAASGRTWKETVGFDETSLDRVDEPLFLSSEEAWAYRWPQRPMLIVANELLDAFPVHRVEQIGAELVELGVAVTEEMEFFEVYLPVTDSRITDWLARSGTKLRNGAQTEVNLAAIEWLNQLADIVPSGRAVIIDYGHDAEEYAAEHRKLGTLMCYWKHQASGNPYIRLGEQDITAHVPYTMIKQAAESSGWKVTSYTTQKQFLVDNGILELLQSHNDLDPFSEASRSNRAVRQLLLSDGMSESFKVLVLDKR